MLQGYLLLRRLNIEPQSQKTLEEILTIMRRQAGPQVFDPIWAEVTGGAPLPEWLVRATGGSPQGTTPTPEVVIPAEALPEEARQMLQQMVAQTGAEGGPRPLDDLPEGIQQALAAFLQVLLQRNGEDQEEGEEEEEVEE